MQRRTFLAGLTASLAVGGAGCTSRGGNRESTPPAATRTGTPGGASPTPTRTATAQATAPGDTATDHPATVTETLPTESSPATPGTRTATPTEHRPPSTASPPTETPEPVPTPPPSIDRTVTVGANGIPGFTPIHFEIAKGDTVQWVWESDDHSIRPDGIPPFSRWKGTPNTPWPEGYTHTYTFSVGGDYGYYCGIHGQAVRGAFTVS